jgi:hypothetical protein
VGSDEDRGRSRRPGAEDYEWSSTGRVLGGWTIGRSSDACMIRTVHKEMRSMCFLVEPQNQGRGVSRFGPQNRQLWFGDLDLKIIATVSWFGPQN